MNRIKLLLTLAFGALAHPAFAQNVPPVVATQIPNFTIYSGAPALSIDLAAAFSDPDVSHAVRLSTNVGSDIDIALHGQQKPITVANFLRYVDEGRYFLFDSKISRTASSFIHRSLPGFVIQGGGYIGTTHPTPPAGAPGDTVQATQVLSSDIGLIQNEPGISNQRGTIAMAKVPGNPNSATSEWFINLADNGGPPNNLDTENGGFTVFGRVASYSMPAVDFIAALPRYNSGAPFDNLPLRNYTSGNFVRVTNLISVSNITKISPLTYSIMSNNGNVTAVTSDTKLLVFGTSVGTAHITVTATDLDGATVSQMFTVNVTAAPGRLVNLSTRMQVGTGDNALIAGFIMQGSAAKRLAVRALGPSLTGLGVPNALANPILELRDSTGATIATNDDWGSAGNNQDVTDVGLALGSPQESAILTTVPSGTNGTAYTAILRGLNDTTGVGVVEVYDLDSGPGSTLLNISTRGQVGVDPNALIAGFTLGGPESKRIFVRAIGPSLTQFGIPNALVNPTLELRNAQGGLVDSNDDWMNSPQKTQIEDSGLAPTNTKESAVVQTLAAGQYTAIMRGVAGGTGIGSVEVYQLP